MALYVPAGARRRRLVLIALAGLVIGGVVGFVGGRASAPGLEDEVAEVQELAVDAATSLQRIPIEYEQAVTGEGGESTETIISALQSAERQLDDAYSEAIWLTDAARSITAPAFDVLTEHVRDGDEPDDFEALIGTLVRQIEVVFNVDVEGTS